MPSLILPRLRVISSLGAPRPRLATLALALLLALGLAALPLPGATLSQGFLLSLAVAALACLSAGVLLEWTLGIPLAVALLGLEYLAGPLFPLPQGGIDPRAAPVGAALLLVAELAYWSLELRTPTRDEAAVHAWRAASTLALAAAGGLLAGVPLITAALPLPSSPLLTLVGAAAAVAILALPVVRLSRPLSRPLSGGSPGSPGPD